MDFFKSVAFLQQNYLLKSTYIQINHHFNIMLDKLLIFKKIVILLIIPLFLQSCGGFFKPDWSKPAEPDVKKRARQNVIEGKGFSTGLFKSKENTNFTFASSNPLWRASLEIIDFMSLSSVDYAGGLIITDWYSENNPDESIKIVTKFLSNEIRADGIEIDIRKKSCNNENKCLVKKIETDLNTDIKEKILKLAAIYQKEQKENKKKSRPKKVYKGDNE